MPSHLAAPLSHCPAFQSHSVAELHSSTAVRTDAFTVLCSPVPWRSTPLPLRFFAVQSPCNARPRNTLLSLRVVHQSNAAAILRFAIAPPRFAVAMLTWAKPSLFDSERCLAVALRVNSFPRRRNAEHSLRTSVPSHSMLLQNCSFLCRCFAAHGVAPPLLG